MVELIPNRKYILHKGQPSQEVVTFIADYPSPDEHLHRVFVVTGSNYTKQVNADDLTPIPDTKLKKVWRYLKRNWKEILASAVFVRQEVKQLKK